MNEALINNWNDRVKNNDLVYFLGDFALGNPKDLVLILNRLKGNIILIRGSHEKTALHRLCRDRFKEIHSLLEINPGGIPITLCHYCMKTWSKSHYNAYHLFAHIHGNLKSEGKSWDVGVDNNDFKPVSLDEIIKIMNKLPDNFNLVKKHG